MASSPENRQKLSGSNNEQERAIRENDTRQLVHDLIGRHTELFADPNNRIEFVQSQGAEDFLRIAKYVNAKLRSEKPHELRQREDERGAFLPMMHTPSLEDKPAAFKRGYEAIQEYAKASPDSVDKKIEGIAMATEALVIWVHPFNDGNGRTGRFLAKLIEEGAVDVDSLAAETASGSNRARIYDDKFASREGRLAAADNEDIMYDDDEREEMREMAKSSPTDIESMYLSVKRLLEDDSLRQKSLRHQKRIPVAA